MEKRARNGESGFTLIEIIAVLLVLAVLAAVAVPRYLSLVDDARTRALDGALAAGYSQLSLSFAQQTLANGVEPTAQELVDNVATPQGDFTYSYTVDGDTITVTATDENGTTASGDWTLP